jgi:hypothetical protein
VVRDGRVERAPARRDVSTLGILASWAAALFGGWAFVAGLVGAPAGGPAASPSALAIGDEGDPRADQAPARSAARALAAAMFFAVLAAAALAELLLAGDFTVNYVARSMASNVPPGQRPAALFQLASGAVLPTAALVALVGAMAIRGRRSSMGVALVGSVVMALVAASLAAQPFATLPWVPTEGLGLSPALLQPLSVVGHLALSAAIAAAAASAALAADRLGGAGSAEVPAGGVGEDSTLRAAVPDVAPLVATLATLAATGVAMWGLGNGGFLAGVTTSPAPVPGGNGLLLGALVAAVCSWRACGAGPGAALAASLGSLGLLITVLLATPLGGSTPLALSALAVVSLVAAVAGGTLAAGTVSVPAGHSRAVGTLEAVAMLLAGVGAVAALLLPAAGPGWMRVAVQGALAASVVLAAGAPVSDPRAWPVARVITLLSGLLGAVGAWWLVAPEMLAVVWGLAAGAALGGVVGIARPTAPPLARARRALLLGAGSVAAFAALGEANARSEERSLRVGSSAELSVGRGDPVVLAHQGVSRYQDGNAHVVAVALEATRKARSLALMTAERRDYVDGRDETLGAQTAPPAVLSLPFRELRVTLASLAADESVSIRLTAVAFARGWGIAVALLLAALAVAVLGAAGGRPMAPPTPDTHRSA